jgi:hypothetical protein
VTKLGENGSRLRVVGPCDTREPWRVSENRSGNQPIVRKYTNLMNFNGLMLTVPTERAMTWTAQGRDHRNKPDQVNQLAGKGPCFVRQERGPRCTIKCRSSRLHISLVVLWELYAIVGPIVGCFIPTQSPSKMCSR